MVASPICKSQAQLASWRYGLSDFLLGIFACQVTSYDASCQVDLFDTPGNFHDTPTMNGDNLQNWIASYQWQWHWTVLWKTRPSQPKLAGLASPVHRISFNSFHLVIWCHLCPSPQTIRLFEFHSKWLEWLLYPFWGGSKCFSNFAQKDCNEQTQLICQLKAPSVLPNKPQMLVSLQQQRLQKCLLHHFTILLGCGSRLICDTKCDC